MIYETPQSDSDSLESTTAPGTLVLLNESVDQLSIKSNFSTDLDPFGCQEKYTQKLRNMIKRAQGEFDEQLGRVIITLTSGFAAAEFYNTVSKVKGVLEFIADLRRECTRSDIELLEDTLTNSTISILRLDLQHFRTSFGSKQFSTSAQCEVLMRIIELPCMKMILIALPKEFVELSKFATQNATSSSQVIPQVGSWIDWRKENLED